MSQDPQNETASEEQWMVAIAPGNVQMMDVEQLDAAYQAGQINDNTMVWTQGMDAWLPLAKVIGGEESPAEAAPVADAAPAAVAQTATAQQYSSQQYPSQHHELPAQQVVQQQVDATTRAWQQQADVASAAAFGAAHGLVASAQTVPQALGSNGGAPNFAPVTASGFPPVVQPAFRAPTNASGFPLPVSAFPPAAAPKAPPVPSTVPVAMNLEDLDLGSLDMPKKKSKLGLFAAAALVLGAGAITVMNLDSGKSAEKPVAGVAAAHGADEGNKPLVKNDPNAPLNVGAGYTVTDAEKAAFAKEAEKDQEMRDKMAAALTGPNGEKADTSGQGASASSAKAGAAAMKARFGGGGGGKKSSSSSGGSKGGSTFDPLNGDL